MRAARIGIGTFLLFLAALGVLGAGYGFFGDPGDIGREGAAAIGVLWLVTAIVFAAAAVVLLRRADIDRRTIVALSLVLVLGAVLMTVTPLVGAPVTAVAALVALFGFRSSGP